MKKAAFALSGIVAMGLCPLLAMTAIMATDSPRVTASRESRAMYLAAAGVLVPVVWLVAAILCAVEAKRKSRKARLRAFTLAPYVASTLYAIVWWVLIM